MTRCTPGRHVWPHVNRRNFLKTFATLQGATIAGSTLPRFAFAADHPLVFTWSGWEDPALHQPYLEKYGEDPEFSFLGSPDEAFNKVRAGFNPDVVSIPVADVQRWIADDLIDEIDTSRLSHWEEIYPSLASMPGGRKDGKQYFVPGAFTSVSMMYRTDLVDFEGPESWALLWDERYKDQVSTHGSSTNATLIISALVAGVSDAFDMTSEELELAGEYLRRLHKNVKFYWESPTVIEQAMATGEIVASYGWSESFVRLKKEGVPVAYANPKEGLLAFVDGFGITKNRTANEAKIYDYLDAWISPETTKFLIEEFGFIGANQRGRALVDESVLKTLGLENAEQIMRDAVYERPIPEDKYDSYHRLVAEIMAGG